MDNGDDIYYTGQGGNNTKGDCRQNHNQKMERGNLALQNNIGQDVPVRVIRGHKSKSSDGKPGMTYTYDGLYKVVNSWPEKGASGFNVYKFHLKRIQGQPQLTTKQVWCLICIKKKRVH
ncbi:hypothetical protein MKW94_017789 [Papaver nudicaule]|uniref:YDG domain-containing protein n=1 Tax=Papaver nudicaule TaxID=74823 RepID=A0AA41W1C2_PAPNU|nr:hypothetical protein [Papaver nudicaule]